MVKGERTTPDAKEDFAALLKDYGVKEERADIISKHIADTGTIAVFDDPMQLMSKLASFPRDVAPVTRKAVLDHWIALRKLPVPEEYEELAEMPAEVLRKKGKAEPKYGVDPATGRIRMAMGGETPLTLAEAEQLSQKIKQDIAGKGEGEKPKVIKTPEGIWTVNPEATAVDHMDYLLADYLNERERKGEPTDPLTAMAEIAEKWKAVREALGIEERKKAESPVSELLEVAERIATYKEGPKIPDWMSDPVKFQQTVKELTAKPGESEEMKAMREQLSTVLKTVEDMKEDKYKTQLKQQQDTIDELKGTIGKLVDKIEEMEKPVVGRSGADIIYEVGTRGIDTVKAELSGLRSDVREIFSTATPLLPAPEEEREKRRGRFRKRAIEDERGQQLWEKIFRREVL